MSQFEFIFVLISMIAGLALAQLLAGMARPPRNEKGRIDVAHVAFSLATILLLVTVWWATFRWQSYEVWTFTEFMLLCGYISLFYVKAVILTPLRGTRAVEFREVRIKFYAVLAFYCLLEPVVIFMRDREFSSLYLPMMIHMFLLSLLGMYLKRDRFDRIYSIWLCVLNLIWSFLARFMG